MLSGPKVSEKTLSPISLRQSPLAPTAPDPALASPRVDSSSDDTAEEPVDDASEESDSTDTDAPYQSPHAPGMGEILAAVSATPERENRTYRSTPFLSGPEISQSRPKRRSGPGKLFIAILYFLAFDLIMLVIFRKQVVEFWHDNIARTRHTSPAALPQTTPPVPPPTSPESAPPPAESPEPSAEEPATTPNPTAEAAPVPQAIPITEEQLAKLPGSSIGIPPASPAPTSAPPPVPAPAPAPSSADAPFAVSDAWVFGPPASAATTTTTTTPAVANPEKPLPLEADAPIGGLPPPPPDMALPNGPLPGSPTPAPQPAPAATSFANVSSPGTNRIPPEAKSAFDAISSFLNAPDWKTRAKFSMQADKLTAAMAKHAQEYGDGPIAVDRIEFVERHTKTPGSTPYCMFELQGSKLPHRVLALVIQPDDGPVLVDWEAFMEFRHDYLLKFLETQGAPNQQFRVMLRRKHYFDKDVPGIDSKESYQITQPNLVNKYEGHVFVQKDTPLSTKLGTQLGWGMDMPVIVELAWKTNKKHHWVEIVSIPHYGWRNS